MTDKELRLAIDQIFNQVMKSTSTIKLTAQKQLDKLYEEQVRRAKSED